ncbi:hypothetical protein ACET3Z_030003 [Daucus carota]
MLLGNSARVLPPSWLTIFESLEYFGIIFRAEDLCLWAGVNIADQRIWWSTIVRTCTSSPTSSSGTKTTSDNDSCSSSGNESSGGNNTSSTTSDARERVQERIKDLDDP